MRRGHGAPTGGDLDVLDPATGEPFDPAPPAGAPAPRRRRRARQARLRSVAALLFVASIVSLAGAGYRLSGREAVRGIDRSWTEAMALDGARRAADDAVLDAAPDLDGPGPRNEALRDAFRRIGDETVAGLLAVEDDLRRRRIVDRRVAQVRGEMLEALRFRRFQLSPERELLGSTPLRRVEVALRDQRRRFDLAPAPRPRVELRSVAAALQEVQRLGPVRTDTLLVASSGRRLLHVDVDAGTIDARTLRHPIRRLLGGGGRVIVDDGTTVTAYPARADRPALWSVEGSSVIEARSATAEVWVTTPTGEVVAVSSAGRVGDPVPVPAGAEVLADTPFGLLVRGAEHQIIDHVTGATVRTLPAAGRFVGASDDVVGFQVAGAPRLALHQLREERVLEIPLPRTDAGPMVASPSGARYAFAAGPVAGNIASMLVLEADGGRWDLRGAGGPRATVRAGSLAWAPSGRDLFWTTPEGRLAMASDRAEATLLRTPIEALDQLVALVAQG